MAVVEDIHNTAKSELETTKSSLVTITSKFETTKSDLETTKVILDIQKSELEKEKKSKANAGTADLNVVCVYPPSFLDCLMPYEVI